MQQSVKDNGKKLLRLRRNSQSSNSPVSKSTAASATPVQHQQQTFLISDPRFLFLVEFSAGALGGVVSRTVYAEKLKLLLFI